MASLAQQLLQGAQTSAEKGLGVGEATDTYLEVGNMIQQTEQRRVALENQKQQLQLQGANFVSGLVDKAKKMKGQQLNAYVQKWIPSALASAGLGDQYEVETIQSMARTPGGSAAMMIVLNDLKAGNADSTVFSNPASLMEYMEKRGIDATALAEMTPQDQQAYIDSFSKEIGEAGSENVRAEAQEARLEAQQRRFTTQFDEKQRKDYDTLVKDLNKQVQSTFKNELEASTTLANSEGVLNDLASDLLSGKGLDDEALSRYNSAATGIVRALGEKGPLAEGDVKRVLGRAGITGTLKDLEKKFISGEPSGAEIQSLLKLTTIVRDELAKKADTKATAISKRFQSKQFPGETEALREASGLDPVLQQIKGNSKTQETEAALSRDRKIRELKNIARKNLQKGVSMDKLKEGLKAQELPSEIIDEVLKGLK